MTNPDPHNNLTDLRQTHDQVRRAKATHDEIERVAADLAFEGDILKTLSDIAREPELAELGEEAWSLANRVATIHSNRDCY